MVDFTFTEEQEMFRKASKEFAETKVAPHVEEMEETGQTPREVIKAIPEEYGGLGLGHVARLIALEEIGRISSAVAMMLQVFHLGIDPIITAGSEEQKQRYLPGLAKGEKLATVAVTEATGGSDPSGIRTEYAKTDGGYLLNGRKVFITNSHLADTVVVLAKSADDPKCFSAFIVEEGMEGFKRGREENKVGMKGCNTGELSFNQCFVPQENLLGQEGKGMRVVLGAIGEVGRAGMVGCALGIHAACLEESVKFANERILYGNPISKLQTIQNEIALMFMDLDASRLLGYRAAAMKDRGERCDLQFAIAKYYSTEAAIRAAKTAVDIHGGYGVMTEYPVQRYYRDAIVLGPSAGTSYIMKVIMARAALF
jgi:alkylation response protein AidB-like acyl-CoA dehydrogenase